PPPPAPPPAPAQAAPVERAPEPAPAPAAAPPPPPSAPQSPPPAAPPPVPAPVASSEGGNGTRGALLSPVVRRLVHDNGLDPAEIPGTGLGGRITRDDVVRYLEARRAPAAPPAPAPAAAPLPAPSAPVVAPRAGLVSPPPPPGARDEVVPFSTIRRVTAEHMVRSKATSAHTLVATEVDFENIDRVRARHKAAFKESEGVNLTYLPFIARTVVEVLRDFPHLNASVGEDALIVHRDVHLGFAVDLAKEGLIVPVVHQADGQSLRGLARSVADLAERARNRRLSADDIAGGTFTITNPGPFGTFLSMPIIPQPQVAILSTDGIKRRPVVVTGADGTEAIAIHSVGMLGLSFDHRAVDGAYAAAFLREVERVLETRDWEAEL
ncbi:MAG: dihydrolipoamide acetyltransferase family protein, partial [Actinomycetota bacterium]|nr:dihydrolipoamide acetyltransferase family protein [Actinomycetota bacterium]